MAEKVKFTLEADQAKAVSGFLKLVEAQKKGETQFRKSTKELNTQDKAMKFLTKSTLGAVAGLASIGAALGVAFKLSGSYIKGVREMGRANVNLEQTLRPLLALGDNFRRVGEIREDVLRKSTAFALVQERIADALFLNQSALSDLNKETREAVIQQSLLLSRIGTDPQIAVSGGAGALLLYKDALKETGNQAEFAQRMISRMTMTADLSKASVTEVMRDILQPLSAGAALGVSPEKVMGFVPSASAVSSNFPRGMTNLRNMFLRMSRAEKEMDIELTGDPLKDLSTILEKSGGDIKKFEKIFELETAAFALALAKLANEIQTHTEQISGIGPGFTARKVAGIRMDPRSAQADILSSAQQLQQNLPNIRADRGNYLRQSIMMEAASIGASMGDPLFDTTAERPALIDAAIRGQGSPWVRLGMRLLEQQTREGGEGELADAMRLRFGETFGTKIGGAHRYRAGALIEQGRTGRKIVGGRLTDEPYPLAPAETLARAEARLDRPRPEATRFSGEFAAELFASLTSAQKAGVPLPGQFAQLAGADTPGGQQITLDEFTGAISGQTPQELRGAARDIRKAAADFSAAASNKKSANVHSE